MKFRDIITEVKSKKKGFFIGKKVEEKDMTEGYTQTIELDAAPGNTRPDVLIKEVLAGTGLDVPKNPMKNFGEFTYTFKNVDEAAWEKALPAIKERITKMYHSGAIRYGSW